jgi:hypothetical protein
MAKQRKFYQHYNEGDMIYDTYEGRMLTVKDCFEDGRVYLCSVSEEDEDGEEIQKEDQLFTFTELSLMEAYQ